MQHMYRMTFGAMLCMIASTSALAQSNTKSIVLKEPYPKFRAEGMPFPLTSEDSVVFRQIQKTPPDSFVPIYSSKVHALALRGITLTAADSSAVRRLIASQLKELVEAKHPLRSDTTAVGKAKVEQFEIDFYQKRVPELRAVLPSVEQAIFDQNLKVLKEGNYSFVNEGGRPLRRMEWTPRGSTK